MAEKSAGKKGKKSMNGKGKWARIRSNQERDKSNLKRVLKSSGTRAAYAYAEKKGILYTYHRLAAKIGPRHTASKNPKQSKRMAAPIVVFM